MKNSLHFASTFVLAGLLGSSAAIAQSVDYGAAEQMFGEPITTSATGSPQRSTEAPADMQIITAAEIRQSGEVTLPGILQRVAGMDVLNFSAGQQDINVRGYDQQMSPRLLVLINGRQVYLDHYGVTVWQSLPVQLSEIRQIEVVKGPNCALFGFNAVSGVVNIITYNPKFDNTNDARVQTGNNGQFAASLATTFHVGDIVSARLSGGYGQQHEWSLIGSNVPANELVNPHFYNVALDVVAQLAPKTELRLQGSYDNSEQTSAITPEYGIFSVITSSEMATLTSDTEYGLIEAKAYRNELAAKYYVGMPVPFANAITVVSLQDLFKIGSDHTFRIEGEYRHNTMGVTPLPIGKIAYDVFSLAGMWNWVVTDQITTTAAFRYDTLTLSRTGTFPPNYALANNSYWDRTIAEPSANATVAWRPTPVDTLKLSYGRGVQTPSLTELGGMLYEYPLLPGVTIDISGNPNLAPSIVENYELSYDHQFSWLKAGLRLFLQDWTNIKSNIGLTGLDIYPTATTNGAVLNRNVGGSRMQGVELTLSGQIVDALSWRADYTYTDVKDKPFAGANLADKLVAFQSTTPKYRGNVGLTWAEGSWEADANLHYVGKSYGYDVLNNALRPVGAFATLSSRIAYRVDDYGVTLALSGQNLTNERQLQTTGLQAERRFQFTVSKDW